MTQTTDTSNMQEQIEEAPIVSRFRQWLADWDYAHLTRKVPVEESRKMADDFARELSTIASKSAEVELPHGLKITSYGFDDYNHPTIDRVAEDKYSIRFMRMRFTKRGDWIHEPQPSSRTPSFFKRTQMTLQEAFEKYPKSIEALSQKEQS